MSMDSIMSTAVAHELHTKTGKATQICIYDDLLFLKK